MAKTQWLHGRLTGFFLIEKTQENRARGYPWIPPPGKEHRGPINGTRKDNMKLEVLYKDDHMEEFQIIVAWQDHKWGMDRLYYETPYDEPGKGKFMDTNNMLTWRVTPIYK